MNNLIILLTQAVGDFETVLLIWPKEEELRDHIGRTYVAVAGSLVGLGYTDVTSAQTAHPIHQDAMVVDYQKYFFAKLTVPKVPSFGETASFRFLRDTTVTGPVIRIVNSDPT